MSIKTRTVKVVRVTEETEIHTKNCDLCDAVMGEQYGAAGLFVELRYTDDDDRTKNAWTWDRGYGYDVCRACVSKEVGEPVDGNYMTENERLATAMERVAALLRRLPK